MRILITGTTGQVGSALVDRFRGFGTLIAADRGMLDLSKPVEIAKQLDALKPDIIINPAAYTAVDRAEDERELAFLVNAKGPEAIARWAAARRVPLVHFSTDYVFDGAGEKPWREDDPVAPLNAYGASKLAGEEAIRAAGGPHLILRTAWVYAARGKNFLRTIARLAKEREELRIVGDQIGAPTTAAMIADTVANIVHPNTADLARAFASAKNVVHLAASGYTSWCGFAAAIVDGLKRRGVALAAQRVVPIASKDYPTKAKRPLNSRLDMQRLRTAFNIVTPQWEALLEPELDLFVMNG
ncbi:dTDP-4-dehydrorhamnose reductase [Hyphomicrobium sp.]|uniref:dTDP-4-dehydrorhamnose reductase n=1 Tax=Hyphomicrobium sp. TaxID=82 RepID=UPI002D052CB6|nr:dTDP-4-dehydrorhamnose reductase [Hyphomicrobium sp.]HVZ03558.1 dTDP-4-dehydrorhamnose reductase [Hyphomicrobium sp.]